MCFSRCAEQKTFQKGHLQIFSRCILIQDGEGSLPRHEVEVSVRIQQYVAKRFVNGPEGVRLPV